MAGELGFEPRLTESESAVLPLNYSPSLALILLHYINWFCNSARRFCKCGVGVLDLAQSYVLGLPLSSIADDLQSSATACGDLHLIFEPHVVFDHLPRHADVIGDLVDLIAKGKAY